MKKLLIRLCVFLLLVAGLGAWVGLSIKPRFNGELRSSVFDNLGPKRMASYTFGEPEVRFEQISFHDSLAYYNEGLQGEAFKFDAETGLLSGTHSKFKAQVHDGDILKFFAPGKKLVGEAIVANVNASSELLLKDAGRLHLEGNERLRVYRLFSGKAFRFYGLPGTGEHREATFLNLKAPRGHYYTEHGVLLEGKPPEPDPHAKHATGHGESFHYSPDFKPGEFHAFYRNWPMGKFWRHVQYMCSFKLGRKNGEEHYWKRDGHNEYVKNWKNGILHGKWVEWYPSGEKKINANYENGLLGGEYLTFHPNGEKSLKTHYKNGKLEGRFETWNKHGNRLFNRTYKGGIDEIWIFRKDPKEKSGGGH